MFAVVPPPLQHFIFRSSLGARAHVVGPASLTSSKTRSPPCRAAASWAAPPLSSSATTTRSGLLDTAGPYKCMGGATLETTPSGSPRALPKIGTGRSSLPSSLALFLTLPPPWHSGLFFWFFLQCIFLSLSFSLLPLSWLPWPAQLFLSSSLVVAPLAGAALPLFFPCRGCPGRPRSPQQQTRPSSTTAWQYRDSSGPAVAQVTVRLADGTLLGSVEQRRGFVCCNRALEARRYQSASAFGLCLASFAPSPLTPARTPFFPCPLPVPRSAPRRRWRAFPRASSLSRAPP